MVTKDGSSIRVEPCKYKQELRNSVEDERTDEIDIEDTLRGALDGKCAHFLSTLDFAEKRLVLRYQLCYLQRRIDGSILFDNTCAAQ